MGYYSKIQGMQGELYIGTHAGGYVETAIRNAKKSILVISPYVTPTYFNLLLEKQQAGVEVHGLFHEMKAAKSLSFFPHGAYRGDRSDKFGVGDLIKAGQGVEKVALEEGIQKRKKLRRNSKIKIGAATICSMALFFLFALIVYGSSTTEIPDLLMNIGFGEIIREGNIVFNLLGGMIAMALIAFSARKDKISADKIPIEEYRYSEITDLRFIFPKDDTYIHLKMVIIDGDTAFLGSHNLTYSGINKNLESSLNISDPETIKKLTETFYEIRNHAECYSPQIIGEYYCGKYGYGNFYDYQNILRH